MGPHQVVRPGRLVSVWRSRAPAIAPCSRAGGRCGPAHAARSGDQPTHRLGARSPRRSPWTRDLDGTRSDRDSVSTAKTAAHLSRKASDGGLSRSQAPNATMTSRSAAGQSSAAARPAWSARAWRCGSGALAKVRSRRFAPAMASSQLTHIDGPPAKGSLRLRRATSSKNASATPAIGPSISWPSSRVPLSPRFSTSVSKQAWQYEEGPGE